MKNYFPGAASLTLNIAFTRFYSLFDVQFICTNPTRTRGRVNLLNHFCYNEGTSAYKYQIF